MVFGSSADGGTSARPIGPAPIVGYAGSRRRLLVVDDLEINRRLLRELLEPLGFEVEEASTGEQAWEGLDAASGAAVPDLVLLDLRMPGLDGLPRRDSWQAEGAAKVVGANLPQVPTLVA